MIGQGAIQIQYAPQRAIGAVQWHHHLGKRGAIASDMTGKGMHVPHNLGTIQLDGSAAYPFANGDATAGGFAHKGAQYQYPIQQAIETCPVEVGYHIVKKGGRVA